MVFQTNSMDSKTSGFIYKMFVIVNLFWYNSIFFQKIKNQFYRKL